MKQNRIPAAVLAASAAIALTACGGKAVSNNEKGNNAPAVSAQDSAAEQNGSEESGLAGAKELAKKLEGEISDPRQFFSDNANLTEVCDAAKLLESVKDPAEQKSESDVLNSIYTQIGIDDAHLAEYQQNRGGAVEIGRVEENPALCEKYKSWLNNDWLEFEDAFLDGDLTREQVDQLKRDFLKPDHLYVAEAAEVSESGARATVNLYISQVGDRYYFDYFIEDDNRDVFSEITSYKVAAGDAWGAAE